MENKEPHPSEMGLKFKLLQIQSEVERLKKEGYNDFQKYKYLAEQQVTDAFNPLLIKYGVLFNYSAEIISQTIMEKNILTHVRVEYSFKDVDSDDEIVGVVDGQGIDKGDKGVYKAITGAVKYIFMKNFLIPTGDDPEVPNSIEKEEKPKKTIDYSVIKDSKEKQELDLIVVDIKKAKSIEEIKEIAQLSQTIKLSDAGRNLLREEANIKIKELNKHA